MKLYNNVQENWLGNKESDPIWMFDAWRNDFALGIYPARGNNTNMVVASTSFKYNILHLNILWRFLDSKSTGSGMQIAIP